MRGAKRVRRVARTEVRGSQRVRIGNLRFEIPDLRSEANDWKSTNEILRFAQNDGHDLVARTNS